MPTRTFRSQLGQVALALVNATLLLAVLLAFGLWLLLGRAQDFAKDTARLAFGAAGENLGEQMAVRAAALEQALAGLAALESRVDAALAQNGTAAGPIAAELGALRTDIRALTAALDGLADAAAVLRDQPAEAVSGMLYQILQSLADRLGPPQPPPT